MEKSPSQQTYKVSIETLASYISDLENQVSDRVWNQLKNIDSLNVWDLAFLVDKLIGLIIQVSEVYPSYMKIINFNYLSSNNWAENFKEITLKEKVRVFLFLSIKLAKKFLPKFAKLSNHSHYKLSGEQFGESFFFGASNAPEIDEIEKLLCKIINLVSQHEHLANFEAFQELYEKAKSTRGY